MRRTCRDTKICNGPARVKKPFSSVAVITTVSMTMTVSSTKKRK